MKVTFSINNNIPAQVRPWLDGREFLSVYHYGKLYYWDVPNNTNRSSRVHSCVETDTCFAIWTVDNDDGEVRAMSVSKPLTEEASYEWVQESELFRYMTPVEWHKSVDPRVDTLAEAYLLGMPDKVRAEFIEWAKGFDETRYPNQNEVLEWLSTHY